MLTDGRTDGRKIGRLYRTLLQAGAIKIGFPVATIQTQITCILRVLRITVNYT